MCNDLQPLQQVIVGAVLISTHLTYKFLVGSDSRWAGGGFHISLDYTVVQTAAGRFPCSGKRFLYFSKQNLST